MSSNRAVGTPGEPELSSVARGRAEEVGRQWANELRAAMVKEERRPCGGWPGTLSEARTRVALAVVPWLATNGQLLMSTQQREGAARVAYASARSAWMETREAEEKL